MEDFIQAIVGLFPSPLRGPVQAIANVFLAIWHNITDFFGRVRRGWQDLRNAAWGRILAQLRHAYALAVTLRWLITVYVPRQASMFAQAVRDEARQLWNQAVTEARSALSQLRDWAIDEFNQLVSWVRQFATWASNELGQLKDDAKRLKGRVFGVLGSPQSLAAWAIGAIMSAAVGFVIDNAVPIGRRLLGTRVRVWLDAADKTEDIISRIL